VMRVKRQFICRSFSLFFFLVSSWLIIENLKAQIMELE